MYKEHIDFIEWTKLYDIGGMDVRSKVMHDELQKSFPCEIIYIDGENKLEENFEKIRRIIEMNR